MVASGVPGQCLPRLHGNLAVGFGRQHEDHLGGVDVAFDPGHALGRTFLGHDPIEARQVLHLAGGVPVDPLAAIAQFGHQGSERRKPLVEVRIVPLDHGDLGHGLAGDGIDLTLLPFLHVEGLGDLRRRVVLDRHHDHVLLDPQNLGRNLGEFLRDPLVDVPIRTAFPNRVHRARQRMDERMHVGGIEVVFLVPGGRRQNDVRIDAGGGHPEVEGHEKIQFSFRRFVVPGHIVGFGAPLFAEVLVHHPVGGSEQMLEEIFVPLARRPQQVGPPDE